MAEYLDYTGLSHFKDKLDLKYATKAELGDAAYLDVINNTAKGAVGWNSAGATNANNLRVVNVNTLSYWNGCYNGTNSNLTNCNRGAFGTIVTKNVGDYALANHTHDIYEADLKWGGKNFAASYGCIDAAMVDELGANRFMFAKAAGITVEYTRDGGTTWEDYGLTDAQKIGLFSSGQNVLIGKANTTDKATENGDLYQLRITIDTSLAGIYTTLNKFVLYVSTSGSANSVVTIQRATQSTPDNFIDVVADVPISGWSGYNVVNTPNFTTYGNSASQNKRVRFIFKANGGNTNYAGLIVSKIMGFGGVGWTTPSNMAKTGHLYSFDANQNATFPAKVTATGGFIGNLTGTASSVAIEAGTTNADRYVWFSWSGTGNEGKACYDAAFKYNPYTDNLTVSKINGTTVSSFVQDSDLSAVATSGSYNDLTDKPTIPSSTDVAITNAEIDSIVNGTYS